MMPRKLPRLQIPTPVPELNEGKKIDMHVQQDIRSFKQAPKAKGEEEGRRQVILIGGGRFSGLLESVKHSGQAFPASGRAFLASGQTFLASGRAFLASGQTFLAPGQALLASGRAFFRSGQALLASGQTFLASGQAFPAPGQTFFASGRSRHADQ